MAEFNKIQSEALNAYSSENKENRDRISALREQTQNPDKKKFYKPYEIKSDVQEICAAFFGENKITLEECNQQLAEYNVHLEEIPYVDENEADKDLNVIARAAFNGYFKETIHDNLSKGFFDRRIDDFKPEDYNLDNCAMWQKFKKVPEFAQLEEIVKQGMAKLKISPDVLSPSYPYPLNANDISKIICLQFKGSYQKNGLKQVCIKNIIDFESYKIRNTKRFIAENEEVFRKSMMRIPLSGKDIEAAKATGKTPEQALAYCKQVRAEYVEALINLMKAKGSTNLAEAKDDKGKTLFKPEWANQPQIDVHHINPVHNCETIELKGKNFTDINDYENMCFMVKEPYHTIMHYLDNCDCDDFKNKIKAKSATGKRFMLCPGKNRKEKNNMRALLYKGVYIWQNFISHKPKENDGDLPHRDEKRLQASEVQLKELQQSRLNQGK
ncbi:MAG: hypothetical protein IKK52_05310 [Alphaproteobacteria bacterium]|nr:hypothetical protein [Alphaproteobacteria bacterium]